jgi:hypothetical protein
VHWTGADADAGLYEYDVYVSDNDSVFKPWRVNIKKDSAVFNGKYGHKYEFYSVARDRVFNEEGLPLDPETTPDAVTTVVTSVTNAVPVQPLFDVYPNPMNGACTVRFLLPDASNVSFEVNDVTGRNYISLDFGTQSSGQHSYQINAESLSAGVYFCKLICNSEALTKKITVMR